MESVLISNPAFSNNVAIVQGNSQLTYAQLIEYSDAIAERLVERSLVFIVASNTLPAVAGYLASLRRKAVAIMLRSEITPDQYSDLFATYKPQFVWLPNALHEKLSAAITDCKAVYEADGYELVATGQQLHRINPDTALLLTTSGSTGSPKFVRLTYDNLRANAESIAEYQQITDKDRAITTLPFSYSYGISIVNSHFVRGGSIVLTEHGIMERGFWNELEHTQATNFGGVPFTYQMLEKLRFERMSLPSLRFISQAGGRLGERLQEKFGIICQEKGMDFFVMYGQTEATARMSWLPPAKVLDKLGSIGIAIPGGTFELHGTDNNLIEEPDVAGELVYRGPNVSQGYATCIDDLSNTDSNNGMLETGDIAKRDTEGYYYIVGRKKRFLKVYGNRVNLDELEHALSLKGYEVACVGVDDAVTVFTTSTIPNEVRSQIVEITSLSAHAFTIREIDAIPHTTSGKVAYAELEGIC